MDISGLSAFPSYTSSQDDHITQIHTLLQYTVSPMLKTHHVSITNRINASEPSQAFTVTLSGGSNDDDTNLTGATSLASLKELSKMIKDFQKSGCQT